MSEQQRIFIRVLLTDIRGQRQHPALSMQRPQHRTNQSPRRDGLLAVAAATPRGAVDFEFFGAGVVAFGLDAPFPGGLDGLTADGDDFGGELEEPEAVFHVHGHGGKAGLECAG